MAAGSCFEVLAGQTLSTSGVAGLAYQRRIIISFDMHMESAHLHGNWESKQAKSRHVLEDLDLLKEMVSCKGKI